jgi:dihydrofolate reductase
MRKLILSMDMSLDGYVSGPNGDASWQDVNNIGNWEDLFKTMQNVDLFVLGAGMWPEYSAHWKNVLVTPDQPEDELNYAKIAERTKHIVFSSKIKDPEWQNTSVKNGDLTTEVKNLKAEHGNDIMSFGGASFARSLLDADLVDEYRLVVSPVILAGGKSIFEGLKNRHNMQLLEVKQFEQVVALVFRRRLG